ncbi:MAG TPA: translesion DNA synthesis-associated protein ImuA [Rudaea sp.]|nr:translesion DNA synthesis-associated protein ImuA [Rudaea sp.]
MSCVQELRKLDPSSLPHVWRVADLAPANATIATGHSRLDAALPGSGWPTGCLIEILQQTPARHVWQLLLPALVDIMRRKAGPAVLVGSPLQPFGPSLSAQGLPAERLLCVDAEQPRLRLWAAEQALRCAQVAAVLAWLPAAKNEELRRLHLAAKQHQRLLFVFRRVQSRDEASPATLRLQVQGVDCIEIEVVKRRGPPLLEPLILPATSQRVRALLQARRASRTGVPAANEIAASGRSHVLDRTATVE